MVLTTLQYVSCTLIYALLLLAHFGEARGRNYYGTYIGDFKETANSAKSFFGQVYVVDDSTFFIKNFTFDGRKTPSYFWIGNSQQPDPTGTAVPYPDDRAGDMPPLRDFDRSEVIVRLPGNIKVRDLKWLAIWVPRFTLNLGYVNIPKNVKIPQKRILPEFSRLAHGLRSDNITILDSRTFYIPNLHYDGGGPDAYFWVGNGSQPNPNGIKVPNEMNSLQPLRGYDGVDIEIQLPEKLTVYDIDWLAVWCVQYKHNFGHVYIPKDLEVPPALGQTKIAVLYNVDHNKYRKTG